MAVWIDPVYDRTREDVEYAKQKIAEWIAADTMENSLVVHDLKGCLNVSDLNRIEGNIKYLAEQITKYYYPANALTKAWTNDNMPTEKDIERIVSNIGVILDAFYTPRLAPGVPDSMMRFNEVNAIEENLALIKEILDIMVSSFRKSSTFYSGSTVRLPTRR